MGVWGGEVRVCCFAIVIFVLSLHSSKGKLNMTTQEQIKIIEDATKEALKSKESAMKFLVDSGIIDYLPKPKKAKSRK